MSGKTKPAVQVGDKFITGQGQIAVVAKVYKTGRVKLANSSEQWRVRENGDLEGCGSAGFNGQRPVCERYSEALSARWALVIRAREALHIADVGSILTKRTLFKRTNHRHLDEDDVLVLEAASRAVCRVAESLSLRVESARQTRAFATKPFKPEDVP